jgi:hypothetical protein
MQTAHCLEFFGAANPRPLLRSPDGRVEVTLGGNAGAGPDATTRGHPTWRIDYDGYPMLLPSVLPRFAPEADGVEVLGVSVAGSPRMAVIGLRASGERPLRYDVHLLCSNHGVAIRCRVLRQPGERLQPEAVEHLPWRLPAGTEGYLAPMGSMRYTPHPLDAPCGVVMLPLLLILPHGKIACLTEASTVPVATAVGLPEGGGLRIRSNSVASRRLPYCFSWLALTVADRPADLPARRVFARDLMPEAAQPPECDADPDAPDSRDHCIWPFVRYAAGITDKRAIEDSPVRWTPAHAAALRLILADGQQATGLTGHSPDAGLSSPPSGTCDEIRFLRGEVGAYLVAARRYGDVWWVAGLNGPDARVLTVRFEDFMDAAAPGRRYTLALLRDRIAASPAMPCAPEVNHFNGLDVLDKIKLPLAPHGGFVMRLMPDAKKD